mmetsp:Transcript_29790/g.44184  ORF Transcript_29790/g.44184 Transcript_29790/m.44184 type:complete len:1743 (-) Transcript_29790:270-5498(-)|eukprot:CAMPEP_0195518788 /NCGR_PEP_ID=MMETSP0794_2-20130614/13669_1 /TAXON_ID=515487 /ORGANISM="Stephanopyxis turris, Strain CCMP 815" /LENGTH=1742 /DNA_ID=CAMNT_0040647813 /DNA_START=106 /DNA_END=5334 /DNA_ORIENTATION=-
MKQLRAAFFLTVAAVAASSFVMAQRQVQTTGEAIRDIPVPFGNEEDFSPLSCNEVYSDCVPWSEKVWDFSDTITIPCGECVLMDITDGSTITADFGINIIGKLDFVPDAHVTIEAAIILVQGEMNFISTEEMIKPENQKVKFMMTGTLDLNFQPHPENAASCNQETHDGACEVGKKSIIVAGGKINFDGWPIKTCPTWTNLLDVVTKDAVIPDNTAEPDYFANIEGACSNNTRILFTENFEVLEYPGVPPNGWHSSPGTIFTLTEDSDRNNRHVTISNRLRDFQGPAFSIPPETMKCMILDTTYLLDMRLKLHSTDENRTISCFSDGTDCIKVTLSSMNAQGELSFKNVLTQSGEFGKQIADDEWFQLSGAIEINTFDAYPDGVYNTLVVSGPEEGIDISIDDITLKLPSLASYPAKETICDQMVLNNGADLDPVHSFPLAPSFVKGSYVRIKNEIGNSYFSITGRTKDYASIQFELTQDCIMEYSMYNFRSRIRNHSPEKKKSRMSLKVTSDDPYAEIPFEIETIGWCPEASADDGWQVCESKFMFLDHHVNAAKLEVIWVVEQDLNDVDYDDITVSLYQGPVSHLVLPATVAECWGEGSELIVTSHSLKMEDTFLNKITNVTLSDSGDEQVALLELETIMPTHTTVKTSPTFAVEVALLTRNIVFDAKREDDDANPLHGGHLKIFHTPNQAQVIEGVEVRRFGQLGNIGRYPLHMHMSQNVPGSSISRNTVRDSSQRCIVIHDTHNVTLYENIAYDNTGHCFMIEDGSEEDNVFIRNLGALLHVTSINDTVSITESDFRAAIFWTASPRNVFRENVGAGGGDNGFWFEMLEHVRGPSELTHIGINPSGQPLMDFADNVFHSNHREGLSLYPNGHFPDEEAVFYRTRSFRNVGDGVLFHNSRFLAIEGGVYADNRMQIEVDKQADSIRVSNARIIGFSDLYLYEVQATKAKSHCPAYRPLIGIQLHSFLRYRDSKGYTLENIKFENFGESLTGCVNSSSIDIDPEIRAGHYDAYATFRNIEYPEGSPDRERVNICEIANNGVYDVALQDLTGDSNTVDHEPGFIVSNHSLMTAFTESKCHDLEGTCALFCPNTCFRAVNFGISPAHEWSDIDIQVTDGTNSVDFHVYFENMTEIKADGECCQEKQYDNTIFQRRRFLTPILPNGNYNMTFMKDGQPTWPQFVETVWEEPPIECGEYIDDDSYTLIEPPPPDNFCDNLMLNPKVDGLMNYWMHVGGGVQLYSPGYGGTGHAISSVDRWGAWQGPAQFWDTRCLVADIEYEVLAKVKLEENGTPVQCNPNIKELVGYDACPRMAMRVRTLTGHSIGDVVNTTYVYPLGQTVLPVTADWNTIHGYFTVTDEIANGDSVLVFFEKARVGVNIIVDEITVLPKTRSCHVPIYNTGIETGDSRFWYNWGQVSIDVVQPEIASGNENYALITQDRQSDWASMAQDFNAKCMVEGDQYEISAKIMLVKGTTPYVCDPTKPWGGNDMTGVCPTLSIKSVIGNQTFFDDVGSVTGDWTAGAWNNMNGLFTIKPYMADADRLTVFWRKFEPYVDIIVDDVILTTSASWDCDQLVKNSDAETGDSRYWSSWLGGSVGVWPVGANNSSHALVGKNRLNSMAGIGQLLDENCVVGNTLFEVSAWVMVVNDDDTPFDCDPESVKSDKRCPVATITSQNPGGPPMFHHVASLTAPYISGEFNQMIGRFVFFPSEVNAETVSLIFERAPPGVKIVIDDVKVTLVRALD